MILSQRLKRAELLAAAAAAAAFPLALRLEEAASRPALQQLLVPLMT